MMLKRALIWVVLGGGLTLHACSDDTEDVANDGGTAGADAAAGSSGQAGASTGGSGGSAGSGASGGSAGSSGCKPLGTFCNPASDSCCSGTCEDIGLAEPTCVSSGAVCADAGEACTAAIDCCSLACQGGTCQATGGCTALTDTCQVDSDCCSNNCDGGTCGPGGGGCLDVGKKRGGAVVAPEHQASFTSFHRLRCGGVLEEELRWARHA